MKNIGQKLKQIYEDIYGEKRPSSIFGGGNVGMALLSESIKYFGDSVERSAEKIADAISDRGETQNFTPVYACDGCKKPTPISETTSKCVSSEPPRFDRFCGGCCDENPELTDNNKHHDQQT